MASIEPDEMLVELADQIDLKLMDWMVENKLPPLNIVAIVLQDFHDWPKKPVV